MEHADFYIGRGRDAEYLGTASDLDCSPGELFYDGDKLTIWSEMQSLTLNLYTERDFRDMAAGWSDRKTWPHDYHNSTHSAWTYCYDKGTVYVYHHGAEMAQIRCNYYADQPRRTVNEDGTITVYNTRTIRPRGASQFPHMPRSTDTEG